MAKKTTDLEQNVLVTPDPFASEPAAPKEWDTTLKLGAIEEALYVQVGDVVSSVDRATGEVTVRSSGSVQPHGRSREVAPR